MRQLGALAGASCPKATVFCINHGNVVFLMPIPYPARHRLGHGELMKSNLQIFGGALFFALAGFSSGALSQEIETRGAYCNDNYFNSDGAGISACMEFALKYNEDTVGVGLVGATPEQRGNVKSDPLDSLGRITAWYGREFEAAAFRYGLTARAGIEGGAADDVALALRDGLHGLFGAGAKNIDSTRPTTFIGGASGWARTEYSVSDSGAWSSALTPYGHAAIGNDTIEGGGGILLSLQPSDEAQGLALLLPKNGAYAPTFGGDGIGIFGGVRAVAIETLYEDHANNFLAEAGITGQATLWDFAVVGLSASCTTEAYDGADKPDCKATFQMGGLF